MRKFLLLSFCLLINASAFAADEPAIVRKGLRAPADPEIALQSEDRVAILEREVQTLLGRVELLERSVSQLSAGHAAKAPAPVHIDTEAPKASVEEVVQPHKIQGAAPQPHVTATAGGESEKRSYDAALLALKDGHYEDAEGKFDDFIKRYPKSSLLSNAYFWHGETFFRRNNFEKAAISYLKGYKQFPKASKASDSLLKLALSLGSMKKTKEACGMLSKLDAEFKDRPANSIKRANDARNKYGCSR